MADPKDNTDPSSSSDDFGDDLDEMLKDAESAIEEQENLDELINDEDAIDRLLMDDTDYAATEENTKDIDEFAEAELDEFAENDNSNLDVDELLNSVSDDSNTEDDEFSEQESTVSVMDKIEPEIDAENTEQAANDESDDDFLMADFDISSDDNDLFNEDHEEVEEVNKIDEVDEVDEFVEKPDSVIEEGSIDEEIIEKPVVAPQVIVEPVQDNSAIEAINEQVAQLLSENENFKLQIAELVALTAQDDPNDEEIETLQKDQRKLKKAIKESENKVPVMTYVALGIAILALLIGGGLGGIGYGAQSSVSELSELLVTLEEEIELLAAKDNSVELKKLDDKTQQLASKDKQINRQLDSMSSRLKSNKLKPVVDDLVIQNNHAQEAIEVLLAKVETLEKRKLVAVAKPKPKKPKKILPKIKWVVNLVSFKQEWYAKKKSSEFQKKGVPSEVIRVKVKGENWFRLTVKGFKSKYEAATYAVKVKKSLNLSAVWVTKS